MPGKRHPSKLLRVTNGQRAAVGGLVIAGVAYTTACRIVLSSPSTMAANLPFRWHTRRVPRRRWRDGGELEEVRQAWLAGERTDTIGERHNVSRDMITNLAKREGWPKRKKGPKPLTDDRMRSALYIKLRSILGPEAAKREVFGRAA